MGLAHQKFFQKYAGTAIGSIDMGDFNRDRRSLQPTEENREILDWMNWVLKQRQTEVLRADQLLADAVVTGGAGSLSAEAGYLRYTEDSSPSGNQTVSLTVPAGESWRVTGAAIFLSDQDVGVRLYLDARGKGGNTNQKDYIGLIDETLDASGKNIVGESIDPNHCPVLSEGDLILWYAGATMDADSTSDLWLSVEVAYV